MLLPERACPGSWYEVELGDGVIRLSPLHLDDVDAHLAGEDAELVRWLSGGVSTRQSVQDYIRRRMEQWETGGPAHAFGVRTGSGELVGTTEVQFDQPYLQPGVVNISYGLYPGWRRRGTSSAPQSNLPSVMALDCLVAVNWDSP